MKTIIQLNKHKAKYVITACIPIIIIRNFLLFIKKIYNYIKKISSPHNYNFFFLVYIKMDQNNITSFENDDKSYTMIDLYLNNRFLGYIDSYNYYDTDIDEILLF